MPLSAVDVAGAAGGSRSVRERETRSREAAAMAATGENCIAFDDSDATLACGRAAQRREQRPPRPPRARRDLAPLVTDQRAELERRDARVDRAHAFFERRMRGEPGTAELADPGRMAAGEEHVRHAGGVLVLETRAGGARGHDDEGALQRLRIARELHRRRVGEMLATARDRGLQQAPGEHARAAGEKDAERDELDARRALATAAPCS